MLDGATIAVFADDWGGHPSSAQHLFRRFLPRNRVIWFNTVGQRLPRPTLDDARKLRAKLLVWSGAKRPPVARERAPELVDLPLFPLALGQIARLANARLLRRAVRTRLGESRAPSFLVSTLPLTADLVGALPSTRFVYYVVDDYATWPGLARGLLERLDREQARGADLVVAASQALRAAMRDRGAKEPIGYLPHGVDVAHFARARVERARRQLAGEPPIADAVFFGALDERIDQSLLAAAVVARPALRFLVLGPGRLARELEGARNLERRGAIPYAELPEILGACRTAILPYVRGDFGERLSPLKARESLAAGLSVAASDVPELRSQRVGVHLSSSADEFVAAIDRAVSSAADVPSLDDLGPDSWERRAEQLSALIIAATSGAAA